MNDDLISSRRSGSTTTLPATTGSTSRQVHPERAPGTGGSRPWMAGVATVLGAYAVLTAALVGLGYLLVDELSGARHWDVTVNRWFVRGRDAGLNDITSVGSHLAETLTVIALGLVVVFVLWRLHDRWSIVLVVVGLGLEVSVFLTTTLLVDRHRPPVPKLDGAPPTSSFPSGHTAAACALYLGLVIILNRGHRRQAWRIIVSVVLALVPIAVGLSRLYRGMHHPTDVFAGALLGLACLAVAWRVADIATAGQPHDRTDIESKESVS